MPVRRAFILPLVFAESFLLLGVANVGVSEEAKPAPASQAAPATTPPAPEVTEGTPPPQPAIGNLYIREYRVSGSKLLDGARIGEVVYPFLGPRRTTDDIEKARTALEQAYHDKGYQSIGVSVTIPQQFGRRGVVYMQVNEATVGQLRVNGAKWFLPSGIRKRAPSLAPGTVPNFDDVQRDIIALNKSPDLRVTPRLTPTDNPKVLDIDLDVEDHSPLHGNFELNNRYSENTVPLRLNGGISYGNLWQLGHTFGFNFQIAPERLQDAEVYSAYYAMPFPGFEDNTTLTFLGTKQNSDVSTLGGAAVAGRGEIFGVRANITLPQRKSYTHSITLGFDYKHFDEDVTIADATTGAPSLIQTPITYYPVVLSYSGSWVGEHSFTDLNVGVNFHFRGTGSDPIDFDNKRYYTDGGYIFLRGDISHTRDFENGMQALLKVQGQLANKPLINSEQISAGGQSSVRGYLESAALGDNGIVATLEVRSPSFLGKHGKDATEEDKEKEWRVYAFLEGGHLSLNQPLPDQQDTFDLASIGIGTRIKMWKHYNGSIDASLPLNDIGTTMANDVFFSFRVWADF